MSYLKWLKYKKYLNVPTFSRLASNTQTDTINGVAIYLKSNFATLIFLPSDSECDSVLVRLPFVVLCGRLVALVVGLEWTAQNWNHSSKITTKNEGFPTEQSSILRQVYVLAIFRCLSTVLEHQKIKRRPSEYIKLCSCLCKYWTSWKLKRWWVKCKFSTGTILRTVSKFLYRIPVSFFVGPRTVAKHECYADLKRSSR